MKIKSRKLKTPILLLSTLALAIIPAIGIGVAYQSRNNVNAEVASTKVNYQSVPEVAVPWNEQPRKTYTEEERLIKTGQIFRAQRAFKYLELELRNGRLFIKVDPSLSQGVANSLFPVLDDGHFLLAGLKDGLRVTAGGAFVHNLFHKALFASAQVMSEKLTRGMDLTYYVQHLYLPLTEEGLKTIDTLVIAGAFTGDEWSLLYFGAELVGNGLIGQVEIDKFMLQTDLTYVNMTIVDALAESNYLTYYTGDESSPTFNFGLAESGNAAGFENVLFSFSYLGDKVTYSLEAFQALFKSNGQASLNRPVVVKAQSFNKAVLWSPLSKPERTLTKTYVLPNVPLLGSQTASL